METQAPDLKNNFPFLFWLSFFALQLILFLPKYIFNLDYACFFPVGCENLPSGSFGGALFIRSNPDIFRLSGEFTLLTALIFFLSSGQKLRPPFSLRMAMFSLLFFFFLYYQIHLEFSLKMYGEIFSFVNDFTLIRQVLPIFLAGRGLDNPLIIGGAVVLVCSLIWVGIILNRKMLQAMDHLINTKARAPFRMTQGGLLALSLLSMASLSLYSSGSQDTTIQWTLPKIVKSADTRGFDKFEKIENRAIYEAYFKQNLRDKPNIYLLVIEAYGSVASLAPQLASDYTILCDHLNDQLNEAGWSVASNYSLSPIQGGRSWLAFSSLMTGLQVSNQLQYNDLLYRNREFPHLIRYLNVQGYRSYRLSTLSATAEAKKRIPQQAMQDFWAYTRWFQFDDIPYRGWTYNRFGGIPDQYAMGYFDQRVSQREEGPEFLFFITMNSHAPWNPPPPIASPWEALDTIQPPEEKESKEILASFGKTIEYELSFLTRFIIEKADSNSIFILVGDHQPAGLMHHLPGEKGLSQNAPNPFSCPIHIIARDSAFIESFEVYGFQPGLHPTYGPEQLIHHAGVYSLLMKNLLEHYGKNPAPQIEYLPKGLE